MEKLVRHFGKCRYDEDQVDGRDDREVCNARGNSWTDQISLIFGKCEWQQMLRFFEIELRLVFSSIEMTVRFASVPIWRDSS